MSFLTRRLAKFMEKDTTPPSLSITRPEGSIMLSKKELQRYTWLFTIIDSDGDEQIGGAEGAAFLKRSGLATDQLREVWRLASGGTSKPKLKKEDWLVACKLVSAVQCKGVEPGIEAITGGDSVGIADFHYNLSAEVDGAAPLDIAPASVKVTVTNPTTFGSGLSKHTRYNVLTTTSLPHFPRKEMSVWRRYSDFEWLHKRLSVTFPAAIIPLFPEKRVLGNTDDAFVRDRMVHLEAYMDKIAHHPALSTSLDVLVFLDGTDAGLEAARSFIEAVQSEEGESVLARGVDLVTSAVSRETIPPVQVKVDEEFVAAVAQHGSALARLSLAAQTGDVVSQVARGIADSHSSLGVALQALADHERKHASAGTSAAIAVAAAATAAKRAETALFSGSAGPTASLSGADSAAAAAFGKHSAAAGADTSSISGMFQTNFDDPYAAFHMSTPAANAANAMAAGARADELADLLARVGDEMARTSARIKEQNTQLDELLLKHFKQERDKEAELGEAIKRRDACIDLLQEANAALHRKRRAEASLKPTAADYAKKSAEARINVEKAEKLLSERKDTLERMTEKLKAEMHRVNKARRVMEATLVAQMVRMQETHATTRGEAWMAMLPVISDSDAATAASAEAVTAVARKAEAKARAASQTKPKAGSPAVSTPTAGAPAERSAAGAASASSAGGGSSGGVPIHMDPAMPTFTDETPMPTAEEDVPLTM